MKQIQFNFWDTTEPISCLIFMTVSWPNRVTLIYGIGNWEMKKDIEVIFSKRFIDW